VPSPVHNIFLANNVIAGNRSITGGGILCDMASPMLAHNTFSDNEADQGGALYLVNESVAYSIDSILWGDAAPVGLEIYMDGTSSLEIDFCDVQGGEGAVFQEPGSVLVWGDFNFDEDPLFVGTSPVGPARFDYHLRPESPCVDRGIYAGVDDDMDGDARPIGMGVEIGADEVVIFTLDLDAFYEGGRLKLEFCVGTPEPATWANYMILTYPDFMIVPLWTVPLGVIDPPFDFPVIFPLPSMGWVGIYTGLFTEDGAQAVDLEWVDTGTPDIPTS